MARFGIVTPYFDEPLAWLAECHASVKRQAHDCLHVLVADGRPRDEVDSWDAVHLRLPQGCDDHGGTPRALGALYAAGLGVEYLGFLDGDNWLYDDHTAVMLGHMERSRAAVGVARMDLYTVDRRFVTKRYDETKAQPFADTNQLLLTRPVFPLLSSWALVPRRLTYVHDRFFWMLVNRKRYAAVWSDRPTVGYRHKAVEFYNFYRLEPPPEAAPALPAVHGAMAWWNALDAEQQRRVWILMGGP